MRKRIRREKHRSDKPTHRVLPYRGATPPLFDTLEQLVQQLNFALPEYMISQTLISTDHYLSYAWRSCLFSGKRNAVFPSLEMANHQLCEPYLSHLIVDMETLTTSRLEALETLRQPNLCNRGLHIYLLTSKDDPAQMSFLRAAGPFHVIARDLSVVPFRQALLVPPERSIHAPLFPATEWKILSSLARGLTMKRIARQLNLPYHRVVYRLNTQLKLLGLPDRQSLIHLLHRLTLNRHHPPL